MECCNILNHIGILARLNRTFEKLTHILKYKCESRNS